jgi:signal transduction histidine kinase
MKPEVVFGLENAVWPALLLNAGGVVMRANPAAAAVFGVALSGDAPKLSTIWSGENGIAPEDFLTMWDQSPSATMDLRFRTANGSLKYTTAVCIFNNAGSKWFVLQLLPPFERPAAASATTPSSVPVASTDASALILKQKLDCALQLARSVSLDFNNALTGVLGHASLLLGKAEAGHPWRHSLMEVEKSAARGAEIANELATFSRQEKETRKTPPGNVNAVAGRCVDFFRNAHGAKIAWNAQLENGLFGARFDEAKVQQALTKILENAADAVGAGGSGQITVHTRNVDLSEPTQDRNVRLAAGAYVCVEVVDNGSGIDPEVMPKIFDPFFTTKDKTHRGLGLALAYGIVTNHGGGIAISSQPGSGTSARIYLPAEKGLMRESSGTNKNLHGTETILVVDDESLVLTMAETILTEYGYKVLTASGGQKALALLSRDDTKVDLVVTDLVMPGMGGRELVERIQQLAPTIKILCMSGYVMPSDKQTGTAYLQKPFASQDLLLKARLALGTAAAG